MHVSPRGNQWSQFAPEWIGREVIHHEVPWGDESNDRNMQKPKPMSCTGEDLVLGIMPWQVFKAMPRVLALYMVPFAICNAQHGSIVGCEKPCCSNPNQSLDVDECSMHDILFFQ